MIFHYFHVLLDICRYFDVILQGWSELLWPWIDFDKNVVMDWLDYVLRVTQFIQNSSGIIDIIVNLFN